MKSPAATGIHNWISQSSPVSPQPLPSKAKLKLRANRTPATAGGSDLTSPDHPISLLVLAGYSRKSALQHPFQELLSLFGGSHTARETGEELKVNRLRIALQLTALVEQFPF
ncbi:MAG TPA: hypothetical protein VNX88_24775 [Terriglobales bacterium]|jgi:hypothetical protein|nr:hypothetical protein [Terriglobales bacterium]